LFSDIDLCVQTTKHDFLDLLANQINNQGIYIKSRIPVIRIFKDKQYKKFTLDISTPDSKKVTNAVNVINNFGDAHPTFRDCLMMIKRTMIDHLIFGASTGHFSNYAISLMLIHRFFTSPNMTLFDQSKDFFEYYKDFISKNTGIQVVVDNTQHVTDSRIIAVQNDEAQFTIIDPFDAQNNVARLVRHAPKICATFKDIHNALTDQDLDKKKIKETFFYKRNSKKNKGKNDAKQQSTRKRKRNNGKKSNKKRKI
jgi:DNA polymerase sigma